eukprot:TRINITY_DN66167_c12_g4_i1.p1 TRINITY_DN66167_c12_g4~~TRINITY_DN66167_c12_g4_i1.p1  ORF type:complete len:327 (-),score=11.19 TRINITY_DN66167_c12_g4_i1:471-1451(-)
MWTRVSLLLGFLLLIAPHVSLTSGPKTFGTARKGVTLKDSKEPVLLYDYRPTNHTGSIVTQMWFTGTLVWPTFGNTRISVIVDDDYVNALNFTISLLVGNGFDRPNENGWGNAHIGYTALSGGVYSSLRIPFRTHLQVFARAPKKEVVKGDKALFFMLRGIEGPPNDISLGDGITTIPSRGSHLRLHKLVNFPAKGNSYVSLYNTTKPTNGVFFMLTMQAKSGNMRYLEGRFRAEIDGQEVILSSGTEDYFLSAQYFDTGPFHTPLAGCTLVNRVVGHTFAAYRIHDYDPIMWQKSFGLSWRVGDGHWNVTTTHVSAYAWAYEWVR